MTPHLHQAIATAHHEDLLRVVSTISLRPTSPQRPRPAGRRQRSRLVAGALRATKLAAAASGMPLGV